MRILYMGTPDFAVAPLARLYEAGHEISLVVTQPDRRGGRGKKTLCFPVKEWATAHGLPVFQPEKIRSPEALSFLKERFGNGKEEERLQIGVVAAFGQILPKEVLTLPEYGCINLHASLLPKYRGASPIQEAILNGDDVSGVTIMQMDEGLDTGDILLQRQVQIDKEETGGSLFDKLSIAGADALKEALIKIGEKSLTPVPQDNDKATVTGKIDKSSGRIDFKGDAEGIERRIRAFSPWPGTFCVTKDGMLKIRAAFVDDSDTVNGEEKAGMVLSADEKGIRVACEKGMLCITRLQAPGKKEMSVSEYLRGLRKELTGTYLN